LLTCRLTCLLTYRPCYSNIYIYKGINFLSFVNILEQIYFAIFTIVISYRPRRKAYIVVVYYRTFWSLFRFDRHWICLYIYINQFLTFSYKIIRASCIYEGQLFAIVRKRLDNHSIRQSRRFV